MATRTTPKAMARHIKPAATWAQLAGSRATMAELKKLTSEGSPGTNRKENIHAPFLRRFQRIVDFSVPLKS